MTLKSLRRSGGKYSRIYNSFRSIWDDKIANEELSMFFLKSFNHKSYNYVRSK